MSEIEAFRAEVASYLEKNAPRSLQGRGMMMAMEGEEESSDLARDRSKWTKVMAERGWTAPMWPREYGGGGLSPQEAKVLQQEIARMRMPPPLMGMGLSMIGPTLLVHGNEAQKREHLPKIVTGEIRWCQGFSEPNAGSDLASLRTKAVLTPDGEHYILNGQKTWTSGAQWAHWMFLIARTDDSSKHGGLTFLLTDMKQPGIQIKPIRLLSGNSPFCETFFTDAKALAKNRVGAEGFGWTVAKTLLNFERSGMGTGSSGPAARRGGPATMGSRFVEQAKESVGVENGKLADEALRQRMVQVLMDQTALQLTIERSAATTKQQGAPGPEISMFKLYASELGHRRDELLMAMRGSDAIGWEGPQFSEDDLMLARMWLNAKATTIYGGTSEIQRNIIAKRVLKLESRD